MTASDVLQYLYQEIHTIVAATVDEEGLPVTCAIDIMDADENGLYILTAKGKAFYNRMKSRGFIAMTGLKGTDTMSCVAVSLRGKVKELGSGPLSRLLKKNPYMEEIYPTQESQRALTVFQIFDGSGEWFDLSKKPIERFSFTFGHGKGDRIGYLITDFCTGCKRCAAVCPQGCIDFSLKPAKIQQEHCLHCGNCMAICSHKAIIRHHLE